MLTRCLIALFIASVVSHAQTVDFLRDIRPLLSDNCFACHGPDSSSRFAGIRLDNPGDAFAETTNGKLIVSGQPNESLIFQRISAEDSARRMPPSYSGKELTSEQVAMVRQWIDAGAPWEDSWILSNPTRPKLPTVSDNAWVRNPIDAFVLTRLDDAGLKPAPEANRRTLIRRLALDLTGLPPTPAEVDAFVNDQDPAAYEKWIDEYMSRPAWGEHRGRYWLDAARYADTHGLHIDNYREMWAYRDWVINAFNRNLSFDQFTVDQLAGDLLADPTRDQLVATGFHRSNVTTNEGGVIEDEVDAIYAKDRVDTTAAVWLGLTVGCATCHDHKFDPILQKDFYSLAAFFRNTTQKTLDGNVFDPGPVVQVRSSHDDALWAELEGKEDATRRALVQARQAAQPVLEQWLSSGAYREAGVDNIATFAADMERASGIAASQNVTIEMARQDRAAAWVGEGGFLELSSAPPITADQPFSLSVSFFLPEEKYGGPLVSRTDPEDDDRGWYLFLDKQKPRFVLIGDRGQKLGLLAKDGSEFTRGQWNHAAVTYDGSRTREGMQIYVNGSRVEANTWGNAMRVLPGASNNEVPLWLGAMEEAHLEGLGVSHVQYLDRVASEQELQLLVVAPTLDTARAKPTARLSESERDALEAYYLLSESAEYQRHAAELASIVDQQNDIRRRSSVTHVMHEKMDSEAFAHILKRGMYDDLGERVIAATPSALPPMDPSLPRNRLGLARWLVDDANPVTARVTVNRYWQELFGVGIVPSSEDFGSQGRPPSHPELLDWLAVEFRDGGWNIKDLFRVLVTSSTYRQSAATTPEKLDKDPLNVLYSRGPRFRMDAEMVRDTALAASGLLSQQVGGPSVRPYQPDGIWETVAMLQSNTRFYSPDAGDALYRRSMYTFWKRSAPPPALEIMNAPSREQSTVRRERTNTPLQALLAMNAPGYVEAARHLAQGAASYSRHLEARLNFMTERVLARRFNYRERQIVRSAYSDFLAHYNGSASDAEDLLSVGASRSSTTVPPAELAALTMLANQLLNLDEALNK